MVKLYLIYVLGDIKSEQRMAELEAQKNEYQISKTYLLIIFHNHHLNPLKSRFSKL